MPGSLFLVAIEIALLLLGIALIALFVRAVTVGLQSSGLRIASLEQLRLARRAKTALQAEALIESGDHVAAQVLLKECWAFDPPKRDPRMVDRIGNHNLGVLGLIVSLSERFGRHLPNLEVVEELILSRTELLRSYFEAREKRALLRTRKKSSPAWAMQEYDRRIREVEAKLQDNARALYSQVEVLFESLHKDGFSSEVTYH